MTDPEHAFIEEHGLDGYSVQFLSGATVIVTKEGHRGEGHSEVSVADARQTALESLARSLHPTAQE